MKKFDVQKVFDRYKENDKLLQADIFHLYDTGIKCIDNNIGFHDSRHFNLIIFNTRSMEKRNLGQHDGIRISNPYVPLKLIRIYNDGSTLIRFNKIVSIDIFDEIVIK